MKRLFKSRSIFPSRYVGVLSILLVVIFLHVWLLYFFAVHAIRPIQTSKKIEVKLLTIKPIQPIRQTKHKDNKHVFATQPILKRKFSLKQDSSNVDSIMTVLPNSITEIVQPDPNLSDLDQNNDFGKKLEEIEQSLNDSAEQTPVLTNIADAEPFSLPPSMHTTYVAYINGVRNQAGSIQWDTDGARYQLHIAIPLPFVGTFTYHSEGLIDTYGLAPIRYEEARGKRAPVATNFNRDARQTISFSRVTNTFPLRSGSQDRFSVLWQLVALVRGAPQAVTSGIARVFYVADTDFVEEWHIQALEEEDIPIQQEEGKWIRARHFLRLPRREGDERKLEVWLAESLGWIPVKIRQTEPNGNVLELLWLKSNTSQ